MMRFVVSVLLALGLLQPPDIIRQGDLLFQQLGCGPLCDAIEEATCGYRGYKISHVGIVVVKDGKKYVLEAYGQVRLTPLEGFLDRSTDEKARPRVIVARLRPQYRSLIMHALDYGMGQIGKPYDDVFVLNDSAFYCSELIYWIFKYANNGRDFFPVYPMNFRSLADGKMPQVWQEYFRSRGLSVPQGQPGCNPADYSRSKYLRIIAVLGRLNRQKCR